MEPGAAELYDQALLGILQHVGNVQDFLRVLFGFLYRKTDFYRLLRHPSDRMGFPPGAAQALVLQVFTAFDHMARQDDEKRRKELEEKARRKEAEEAVAAAAEQEPVPAPGQEVEVGPGADSGGPQGPPGPRGAGPEVAPSSGEAEPPGAQAGAAELPKEPPGLPKRQEQFQRNPDSYNGAVRENYTWSQDYTDLELKVPVPKHVVKGRQVSVALSSSSIRVAVLEEGGEHVLMEGKFTHKVNTESSLWSLEPGKCVLVSLNKVGEYWWSAVLEGEEHIDIDKINKERSMATVDEEEHAVLDRLTFDYHQKLQGKPQSHELVRRHGLAPARVTQGALTARLSGRAGWVMRGASGAGASSWSRWLGQQGWGLNPELVPASVLLPESPNLPSVGLPDHLGLQGWGAEVACVSGWRSRARRWGPRLCGRWVAAAVHYGTAACGHQKKMCELGLHGGARAPPPGHPGPHGEQETLANGPGDRQSMGTYPKKSFKDAAVLTDGPLCLESEGTPEGLATCWGTA
ncbi:nudC domain-containing protein 3 isoform X1 [Callorhinus ursinus]|uniref:nudC domain-containing protein 3 isoform X1 n=1 Tax=Callorhinus ursinus TaxID=34884 RepID=UPI003CD0096E